MASSRTLFNQLIQQIRARRHQVADVLAAHERDILIIANNQASDNDRIEALLRAGAPTIEWAKATQWPTGSSVADHRLAADLTLLHAALRLADDPGRRPEYRRWARACANGIGMVIAADLSHMDVPGGLDIHIWRACGTRQYTGICDDELCRICQEHDRARAALRAATSSKSSFPWNEVGLGAVASAAIVGIFKVLK